MKRKKVIIYGIGRFAEYAGFSFDNDSPYEVAGYSIETSLLKADKAFDPVTGFLAFEELEQHKSPEEHELFLAVGNNPIRERLFTAGRKKGYHFASYVSSKAFFWPNLQYGENCFIGEGSVVQPFVEIGDNSILFSTRLGHHCKIGNHTLLSACLLGGNVRVGDLSFLGLHSTIKENTNIGDRNIIGMGAVITSDTEDNSIYTAPAARKRKTSYEQYFRDSL